MGTVNQLTAADAYFSISDNIEEGVALKHLIDIMPMQSSLAKLRRRLDALDV